jgi:hypothetical protein
VDGRERDGREDLSKRIPAKRQVVATRAATTSQSRALARLSRVDHDAGEAPRAVALPIEEQR